MSKDYIGNFPPSSCFMWESVLGSFEPGLVKIKLVLLQLHPCLPIFELRNYISFNVYIQRAIRWGLNRIGLESAFIYLPFKSREMVTKKGNDYKLLEV